MPYAITAQVGHVKRGRWVSTRQVPTFYIDENVQGVRDETDAERVALDIINPLGEQMIMTVTAVRVPAVA